VTSNSRKDRGSATENLYAAYCRANGWPYAEAVKAQGRDTTGMPGLAPEVKARRKFDPLNWLRQAKRNAGNDLGYVVWRPDGMGEKSIEDWGVLLTVGDFTALLRAAGYGTETLPVPQIFSEKIGVAE
jgi:hypothetical protein